MRLIRIFLSTVAVASLVACGGGGGGTTTAISYTGQYLDAPTVGLKYTASPSGLTGTTDSNGYFQFQAGDTVTFVISSPAGDIPAGSTAPATPVSTSTVAVVQVLTLENGPAIAQTLQSLGGTGATIDVSRTSTNVAALTAAEITSIKDYVSSGGVTTVPAKLTVDKDTALSNATATISNVDKRSSSASLQQTLSGLTVAAMGVTNVTGMDAKLKDLSIANYKADGTVSSLCIRTSPIVNRTALSFGTDCTQQSASASWSMSSTDNNTFNITFPNGQVNTITAPSYNAYSGVYSVVTSNVTNLPNGLSGTGVYKVLRNDLTPSQIAGKTITVAGFPECTDGLMNLVISSDGNSYSRSCKTSVSSGYLVGTGSMPISTVSSIPGILFFNIAATSVNGFFVGITAESTVAAGTAVVARLGWSSCSSTNTMYCGSLGLYKYTSQ